MELDTGAAVSVMSNHQWKRMFDDTRSLESYKGKPLQGYAGHEVQVIRRTGECGYRVWSSKEAITLAHCGR